LNKSLATIVHTYIHRIFTSYSVIQNVQPPTTSMRDRKRKQIITWISQCIN